jgi:hypothetical protein
VGEGVKKASVIITHGDVDGMVCAAQLMRREKSNCQIHFSNARWVHRKLSCLEADAVSRLYIADIPASVSAVRIVEELIGRGIEVHWIDHHPCDSGLVERLKRSCTRVEYNDELRTPAGVLLGRWLSGEDVHYLRIANICYCSEKGSEWERNWFRLLSSYTGKRDESVLDVIERLAYDSDFSPDDLLRIESQIELEKLAEHVLEQEPLIVATRSGRQMVVYDVSDSPGVYLGKKVYQYHPVDFCLIRITTRKWQLSSAPGGTLLPSALVGDHRLGDAEVSVQGRPSLLSLETTSVRYPSTTEMVSMVQQRL